jgi:hypothetical protein
MAGNFAAGAHQIRTGLEPKTKGIYKYVKTTLARKPRPDLLLAEVKGTVEKIYKEKCFILSSLKAVTFPVELKKQRTQVGFSGCFYRIFIPLNACEAIAVAGRPQDFFGDF